MQSPSLSQRGSVLLSVVVAIALLAAVTFMLSYDSVSETNITASELERDRLRYVTEAGLAHARSQLAKKTSCSNYGELPETGFAGDTYSASVSPASGSPVTISVTGKLQNGVTQTLRFTPIQAFEAPTTVVLQLSKDTGKDVMIDDFYPNANYGGIDDLTVRSGSWIQQPLIEFDLSGIPAGVNIVSATLDLELGSVSTAGDIGVHRMTRSWVEGTGKGTGNADGATWNAYDGIAAWSQPGGDFDSTLYASAYVSSAKNGQRVTWDIRDLVDGWVSGRFPNYGLMLTDDGVANNAEFRSREATDPTAAPRLTIVYACECGKACAAAPPTGTKVLLVVSDADSPSTGESDRLSLIESWGYVVTMISDIASQSEIDAALATNDVVYISGDASASSIGTKLTATTLGVVNEQIALHDELGFASGSGSNAFDKIFVEDNTHSITSGFSTGWLTVALSDQTLNALDGTLAPDLQTLATTWISGANYKDGLALLDAGATLYTGTSATGRRAQIPWGSGSFDFSALNDNGKTIMQRAIDWAVDGEVSLTGPIAHWKLDDTSGTTAVDSVGGHDGTLQNGPTWTSGQIDGGLVFDGGDDYVDLTSDVELNDVFDGGATVAAWIYPTSWGENGYGRIFDKSTSASSTGDGWAIRLNKDNGGTLNFGQGFSSGRGWWKLPNGAISLDTWQHIAVAYDAASTANDPAIYLDGVSLPVTRVDSPSGSIRSDAAINLRLGNFAGGTSHTFQGTIDDARIYDRMLSAAEIAELATPPTKAPIAHWKLDDGTGTTAFDSAGGHDGTLTNGPVWVAGQLGDAVRFDGSNDRINVPHDNGLNLVSQMTLSAWVHLDTHKPFQMVLTKGDNGVAENYWLATESDKANFGFIDGSTYAQHTTSGLTLETGKWHHIAATFDDAANEVKIYVDGAAETFTNTYTPAANGERLVIGTSYYGEAFDGMIDDVRIYDGILDASEVAALAGAGGGGGPGGSGCEGNYLDQFEVYQFDNSDGTIDWSAHPWQEIGESDGPTAGDIRIWTDLDSVRIRTRDNDNGGEGIEREADLSGAVTATLNYDYRRDRLDSSSDYTTVEISPNGTSGPWTELARYQGPTNDDAFTSASHDVSAFIAANTRIRFKTSSSMGGLDHVWFDNIEIICAP